MYNQRIFHANFDHFSALEVQTADQSFDWGSNDPGYLVMMCYCYSGSDFVRNMARPRELWGWSQSDFLDHRGYATSIVSLVYPGTMRFIGKGWCIVADPERSALVIPVPENADLGLAPLSVPSDSIVLYVEQYVKEKQHSRIEPTLIFAGSRTSDRTNY